MPAAPPPPRTFSRRRFAAVMLALGAGAAAGCQAPGPPRAASPGPAAPDPALVALPALRAAAGKSGRRFGAAVTPAALGDPAYAALIAAQCAVIVPENALKWSHLRPTPDSYDFAAADAALAFATAHGQQLRGHTLIWHEQLPDWFPAVATPTNARTMMVEHIRRVVGRYAGRIPSWDVVNEAIGPAGGPADGLRDTPWRRLVGDDYVALAFRTAAAADPAATLMINEYGIEGDTPKHEAKRRALLALLRHLKEQEVPVHALGLQSHLAGGPGRRYAGLRPFLAEAAGLGLRILVTELDVEDRDLPADIAQRDTLVAAIYRDYLAIVLGEPAVEAVLTWGLSDRQSWLRNFAPRPDGLDVRTLPFDAALRPKPAFWAMLEAFGDATPRPAQATLAAPQASAG
jgi:endo-1,4-beta-xylanase